MSWEKKGIMRGVKFQEKIAFNLDKISDGRGVYHFTLRNTGNTDIIVDDHTQEVIKPGEVWLIESDVAIMNDNMKFKFGPYNSVDPQVKEGVARYVVNRSCEI